MWCLAARCRETSVVSAHLPDAIAHLEQPVVCVEHGMTPKIRVDGVRCWVAFAQEVVGIDMAHPSIVGVVNDAR